MNRFTENGDKGKETNCVGFPPLFYDYPIDKKNKQIELTGSF